MVDINKYNKSEIITHRIRLDKDPFKGLIEICERWPKIEEPRTDPKEFIKFLQRRLDSLRGQYLKEGRPTTPLDRIQGELKIIQLKVAFAPLNNMEPLFKYGIDLVVNKNIPIMADLKIIEQLLKGLHRGSSVQAAAEKINPPFRSQVETAREFYQGHAHMFERRAKETADTPAEIAFILSALQAHGVQRTMPLLDAGCGAGRLTLPLLKQGYNLYGVDASEALIAMAKGKSREFKQKFLVGDLLKTPYPANSFYAVLLMWHMISEFDHYLKRLFLEMRRIIVPGGLLIFDVPDATTDSTTSRYKGTGDNDNFETFLAKIPASHELISISSECGFVNISIKHLEWGIKKYVFIDRKI